MLLHYDISAWHDLRAWPSVGAKYVSTLSYTTRTSHSRPIGGRFEELLETTSDLQTAALFDLREH